MKAPGHAADHRPLAAAGSADQDLRQQRALLPCPFACAIDTANARLYTHGGSSDFAIWSLADPDSPPCCSTRRAVARFLVDQRGPWCTMPTRWTTYLHERRGRDAHHRLHGPRFARICWARITNYPQPGYNHSGWLHENGRLYVMADETHGTDLKLFDVSDPPTSSSSIQWAPTAAPDRIRTTLLPGRPAARELATYDG